jgi:hypothetical protein
VCIKGWVLLSKMPGIQLISPSATVHHLNNPLNIIMRSFTVLATIALAATNVAAIDLRQLYKHADSDGKAFCKAWNCAWSVSNMFFTLHHLVVFIADLLPPQHQL